MSFRSNGFYPEEVGRRENSIKRGGQQGDIYIYEDVGRRETAI